MIDPNRCLAAMAAGLKARVDLLSVVLPRVSPEYIVVAAALHGLLANVNDEVLDVRLEYLIDGRPKAKCDLVVLGSAAAESFYFEFKALWPAGLGENVSGIRADLEKLSGLTNGYVVAFAYALDQVPVGCNGRRTDKKLEELLKQTSDRLERQPVFSSEPFDVTGHGTVGRACLVAWKA